MLPRATYQEQPSGDNNYIMLPRVTKWCQQLYHVTKGDKMVSTTITCYQEQQRGDKNYSMLPRATKW